MASDIASMGVQSGLRLDAVMVLRGIRPVINEFSKTLEPGQLGLIHGANGAGKTTLLRAIAGRLPLQSGTITCGVARLYVGHSDGLSGLMTGRENLQSWAAMTGYGDDRTIEAVFETLGCSDFADTMARLLSRGQRRRLALARLGFGPDEALWLLDEPNVGLDHTANDQLDALITAHIGKGGMVLAATHLDLAPAVGQKRQIWTLARKVHADA